MLEPDHEQYAPLHQRRRTIMHLLRQLLDVLEGSKRESTDVYMALYALWETLIRDVGFCHNRRAMDVMRKEHDTLEAKFSVPGDDAP